MVGILSVHPKYCYKLAVFVGDCVCWGLQIAVLSGLIKQAVAVYMYLLKSEVVSRYRVLMDNIF